MSQLELIPTEPKLTERQQLVLEAVRRAGPDGLDAGDAGRLIRHRFHPDRPETRLTASDDERDGHTVLKALAKKGLVAYRRASRGRPGGWHTADNRDPQPAGMLADDQELPY